MIFLGCLTKNILDIMLASHLSFMSIFVDRLNAEKCFVESEFFDICSDSLHCILDRAQNPGPNMAALLPSSTTDVAAVVSLNLVFQVFQ